MRGAARQPVPNKIQGFVRGPGAAGSAPGLHISGLAPSPDFVCFCLVFWGVCVLFSSLARQPPGLLCSGVLGAGGGGGGRRQLKRIML